MRDGPNSNLPDGLRVSRLADPGDTGSALTLTGASLTRGEASGKLSVVTNATRLEPLNDDTLLREVASHYGTPTYLYDLDTVSRQVQTLRTALPNTRLLYAVKANPNGAVLRHLAGSGLGAEVITLGELERAVRAGVTPDDVLLGGPGQDEMLVSRALELGVRLVSLDSVSQWQSWREVATDGVTFLPRVNPALDPRTHEHLATGAATSKFGMTVAETTEVAVELAERNQLGGFHVHAGSQIGSVDVYDEIFTVLRPLYEQFEARSLDIGGGFAVPGFELGAFTEKVRAFAQEFGLELLVEPGRYLVAPAGVLLSKVLHVKHGTRGHVIADAGMADLLRPALYGATHPVRVVGKSGQTVTVDVDGPLCENADRLGQNLDLPHVEAGDLLRIGEAGAYGFTMASNYASSLRPAEVVVQEGEVRLVRERETVDDLLRLERD